MRTIIHEMDQCFYIEFMPDSVEDSSKLVRMALNYKKASPTLSTDAYEDGSIHSWVILDKKNVSQSKVNG